MVLLWTPRSILQLCALLFAFAVIHSVSSPSPFQAAEAQVICLCSCDPVVNAEGYEFRALIRPVWWSFAQPTFVPNGFVAIRPEVMHRASTRWAHSDWRCSAHSRFHFNIHPIHQRFKGSRFLFPFQISRPNFSVISAHLLFNDRKHVAIVHVTRETNFF